MSRGHILWLDPTYTREDCILNVTFRHTTAAKAGFLLTEIIGNTKFDLNMPVRVIHV